MPFEDSVRSDTKSIARLIEMLSNGKVSPLIRNPRYSHRFGDTELGLSCISPKFFGYLLSLFANLIIPPQ